MSKTGEDTGGGRASHTGWADALSGIEARIDEALAPADGAATPLLFVAKGGLNAALEALGDPARAAAARAFAEATGFRAAAGEIRLLPDQSGKPVLALVGCGAADPVRRVGAVSMALPDIEGGWRFVNGAGPDPEAGAREWLLGAYRFERYTGAARKPARLACALSDAIRAEVVGTYLARDLVNTPAGDLGPEALEEAARALAKAHGATVAVTKGAALLEANLPMIHAVGRAAAEAPRLIDIAWSGSQAGEDAPLVVLVGKGVCFDTGGLDIKPSGPMRNMKKDMGGSAAAIAAASILMRRDAPIRLWLLVPAVENAIGSDAFRPGDILDSRAGPTVEIDNTDAEGRLVLADALTLAAAADPALMVDFATLTGAARVALGPELPPLYANDDDLAADILSAGEAVADPMWRMPLHTPYAADLSSKVADMKNGAATPFAGSITAALFLQRFIGDAKLWAHLDIFAWNPKTTPGRPEGGEAQGARAVAEMVMRRFGGSA